MMILVAVIVTMAVNGRLFDTTKDAAYGTEKAAMIEQMYSEIVSKYAKGQASITKGELVGVLEKYGEVQYDGDNEITGIITAKGYEIPIEEIWQIGTEERPTPWSFADANNNGEYDLFEIVTCDSETFYVIPNNGGTSSDKVTLLSAKVIDTTTLEQYADLDLYSKAIPFSNTNYWAKDWVEGTRIDLNTYTIPATSPVKGGDGYDKNDYDAGGTEIAVEAYAIKAARDYGANLGGTGRLMTYEEAIAIQNDLESNQEILSGISPERRRLLAWFYLRISRWHGDDRL